MSDPADKVTACERAGRHQAMRQDPATHRARASRRYRWTDVGGISGECCDCGSTVVVPFELTLGTSCHLPAISRADISELAD